MSKILRINTRTKTAVFEDLGAYAGLGGRALTSRMVLNEVPATCHPLSAANKLVIAAGVLTGTAIANSGRISLGAKSPLTGGIKESNSGGQFAQKLARLGILAVVLEDKPAEDAGLTNIIITKDGVKFVDAAAMAGKGTYDCMDAILKQYGDKTGTMLIGPAGETCRMAASVQFSDPEGRPARAAGRGGLGAVMGSKKIKAIVLDDAGCKLVAPADAERLGRLIARAGLPLRVPDLGVERYADLMQVDKKAEGGEVRFVLLHGLGRPVLRPAPMREAQAAIAAHVQQPTQQAHQVAG